MIYRILAELVLVIHFCFVLFVVLGGLLVLRWPAILWLHLPAFVWGILVQCFFWSCPLTPLENWFRRLGGEAGYTGGFVEHYIMAILYANVSRGFQVMLGLLLIGVNALVYSLVFMRRRRIRDASRATSAAEQLIQPERNELEFHRQLGCCSTMLPARLIRALDGTTRALACLIN